MADHVKMKRITILFLAATQLQIDKNHGIKDLLPFVGRISEHLQQPSMPLFWAAVGTRTSFRPQSVGKYWEQRQKDCIRRINPPSSEKPIVEGNLCSQCIYPAFEVIPFSGTSCPPKPATEQPARPPPPPSLVALSQPSLPPLVVQSLSGGDQNGGGLSILLSHSLPSSPHALHWLHCIRFGVSLSERASCARRQRGCFCVVWSGRVAGRITVEDEKVSVLY